MLKVRLQGTVKDIQWFGTAPENPGAWSIETVCK